MSKKIAILGGVGNGSVIAAAIEDARRLGHDEWDVAGYLNDREPIGSLIEGLPVLGTVPDAPKLLDQGYYFINTIYRIDGQDLRIRLFEDLHIPDDRLATFIHPSAYVAPNVELGPGNVIMPHVCISPGTKFGRCCLVMVGALVGHNDLIGDHCHVAAHAVVGAYLKIGVGAHVGLNATVRENLTLGTCSTLGMGGVLVNNMADYEIWAGVPAKFIRNARKELPE